MEEWSELPDRLAVTVPAVSAQRNREDSVKSNLPRPHVPPSSQEMIMEGYKLQGSMVGDEQRELGRFESGLQV
jgi:hypothetical protein